MNIIEILVINKLVIVEPIKSDIGNKRIKYIALFLKYKNL